EISHRHLPPVHDADRCARRLPLPTLFRVRAWRQPREAILFRASGTSGLWRKPAMTPTGLPAPIAAVVLILAGWGVLAAATRARQLASEVSGEGSGYRNSQDGAETDAKHDDPPDPGGKTIHGVLSPPEQNEGILGAPGLIRGGQRRGKWRSHRCCAR